MSVTLLAPDEAVRLDFDRLQALWRAAEPSGREATVCSALERVALLLAQAERCWRDEDWPAMDTALATLGAMAASLGMGMLARVAEAVRGTLSAGDSVALAATLARALRIGEGSLIAVWDEHDALC